MSNDSTPTVRVLLVEDEVPQAELIRRILSEISSQKYEILTFGCLRDAVHEVLNSPRFDVALLDLTLPDCSGLRSFTVLATAAPDLPIVILTGLDDETVGLEAVRAGAQEYLVKGEVDVRTVARFMKYAIERKRTEIELRRSEERFHTASRATNDVIWDWDLTTNKVWWNDNAQEIFRMTPDQIGTELSWWSDRIHPEDQARFKSSVDAVIHSGWQFWSSEYRFMRGDGTYVPVLDRGYVVQDREGSPVRMIGAMMDLSERKRAEQTLLDYTAVLGHALEGISTLDLDGKYFQVNSAYAAMLGYTRGEMNGMDWKQVILQDDHDLVREARERMMKEGKAEAEVRGVRKDGSLMYGRVVVIKALNADKNMTGYYQFMKDVTERKRMEEGLIQAQKMEAVTQLAGGIAHDFNNVLAALIGFARLASDEAPGDSELKSHLAKVLAAGDRAAKLVEEIASFSKRPGEAADNKAAHQLDEMTREIVKFLRPTLPSNVFITTKIPENLPAVMVDPVEIRQVLVNLCMNASQAMPDGGTLTVSLAKSDLSEKACREFGGVLGAAVLRPGAYLVLSVEDTGGGIDPAILPKIFDTAFSTRHGSGMGLTAVLNFAKRQNGDIRVHSELGQGTRLELFLPAIASVQTERAPPDLKVEGGKESILVVDDEDAVAELLGELLDAMGYRATVKTSSLDALALFRDNPKDFDLVVLDQIMPAMTGDKLAEEIVGVRPGIPIILCSGYTHILSDQRMKEAGIRKFLTKPLGRKQLEKEVRTLLDEAKSGEKPNTFL